MTNNLDIQPDIKLSVKQTFGFESDMEIDAFSKRSEFVPEIDKDYKFDRDTTLAILSGFNFVCRVVSNIRFLLIQYYKKRGLAYLFCIGFPIVNALFCMVIWCGAHKNGVSQQLIRVERADFTW